MVVSAVGGQSAAVDTSATDTEEVPQGVAIGYGQSGGSVATGAGASTGDPLDSFERVPAELLEDGEVGIFIGDDVVIASSEEELRNLLSYASLLSGKPVEQLTTLEFRGPKLSTSVDVKLESSNHGWEGATWVIRMRPEAIQNLNKANKTEFFGETIPFLATEQGIAPNSTLSATEPGLYADAQAYGFAGAAQRLYDSNYGQPDSEPTTLVDKSKLDPDVRKWAEMLFGADTPLDTGHLNVMKALGIVQGSVQGGPGSWTVDPDFKPLTELMTGPRNQRLVKDSGLLGGSVGDEPAGMTGPTLDETAQVGTVYITDSGYSEGYGAKDVEKVVAKFVEEATEYGTTPLPDNIKVEGDVQETLNLLHGLPAGNSTFTAAQVNAAVVAGLVTIAPDGTTSLTADGQFYLNDKRTNPADSVDEPKPTTTADNLEYGWDGDNYWFRYHGKDYVYSKKYHQIASADYTSKEIDWSSAQNVNDWLMQNVGGDQTMNYSLKGGAYGGGSLGGDQKGGLYGGGSLGGEEGNTVRTATWRAPSRLATEIPRARRGFLFSALTCRQRKQKSIRWSTSLLATSQYESTDSDNWCCVWTIRAKEPGMCM